MNGRPIHVGSGTVFYCFIVADIVGEMADWTFSWNRSPDGKTRYIQPGSGFQGIIQVMGWDDLLRDARARNMAFFDAAGINTRNLFSVKEP